jgi:hypothetical protein
MNTISEIDAALLEGNAVESIEINRAGKWTLFASIVRWIGAAILICSSLSFLLQRWVGLDSLIRYHSFLGFTLVLSIAGIFCGIYLKETKGARTFLAIATAFLPAHFIQLGALVFSRYIENHQELFTGYSSYVRNLAIYTAPSTLSVAVTMVLAAAVLIPIAYLGFSSLARCEAKRLTALYLATNALLLIPTRDGIYVAAIALVGITIAGFADSLLFSNASALKTKEGRVARFLTIVPTFLLIGRSLVLYPSHTLLFSSALAMTFVAMFYFVPKLTSSESVGSFFQAISMAPAALAWGLFLDGTIFVTPNAMFFDYPIQILLIPFLAVPMAVFLVFISFLCISSGENYRKVAATISAPAGVMQLLVFPGIASATFCIVVSAITLIFAFTFENKATFIGGAISLAIGLFYHLVYAVDALSISPWLTLAIAGTSLVVFASYFEKNQAKLFGKVASFRTRLSAWN